MAFENGEIKLVLSKAARIRMLNNELESAWCCTEGLAPVKSPCVAVILCFFNIILPGWGTIFSICAASENKNQNDATDGNQVMDVNEGFPEDDNGSQAVVAAPAPPPVMSMSMERKWSRVTATFTGILQFLTAGFGLGWIWSISHGLILYENAKIYKKIEEVKKEPDEEEDGEGQEDEIAK